jgi:hypothetical protein
MNFYKNKIAIAILLSFLFLPIHAQESPYAKWSNGPSSDPNFFPIGVWCQEPSNAAKFKEIGINTYICLWDGPTESQLTQLEAYTMPAIATQNNVGLTSPRNYLIKGWMQQDEPDNAQSRPDGGYDPCVDPAIIQQKYFDMKRNDPTRPVYMNLGRGVAHEDWYGRGTCTGKLDMYPEYIKGADIISFDIYPVTSCSGNAAAVRGKLEYVARGVERLVDWADENKIVWNILETTHIGCVDDRPTPEEIRAEVWMSLIHGSMGIDYFVHEWTPSFKEDAIFRYPEIVDAVKRINLRITSLAPVLNSPSIENSVTVSSSVTIKTMVKQFDNNTHLFAVAMQNTRTTASFTIHDLQANAVAEVLDENRQIAVTSGQFQDDFNGYGVHLYRISTLASGQCSATDSSCGIWPSCQNCNSQDGCSGNSYRNYRCQGTTCTFTEDNCSDCSCPCGDYNKSESIANNNCADAKDNDCDGRTDSADEGCQQPLTCGNGSPDVNENCSNCPQDVRCAAPTICCSGTCIEPECSTDANCSTGQHCTSNNPCTGQCADCNITCTTSAQCNDNNATTIDTCENQGSCESYCKNEPVTCGGVVCQTGQICCNNTCTTPACTTSSQCNDSDACTRDSCTTAGTCTAKCTHTAIPKCGWKKMNWTIPSCFPIAALFTVTLKDETGAPLGEVEITYGTQKMFTSAEGKVEMLGEKSQYTINATKEGYYPLTARKLASATCKPTYTTTGTTPTPAAKGKIEIEVLETPYINKEFTIKITDNDSKAVQEATITYSQQTTETNEQGQATLTAEKSKYLITATSAQGTATARILPRTFTQPDQNTGTGTGTTKPFTIPLDIIALAAVIVIGIIVLLRARATKKETAQ